MADLDFAGLFGLVRKDFADNRARNERTAAMGIPKEFPLSPQRSVG